MKRLLADGEMATGRVTKCWMVTTPNGLLRIHHTGWANIFSRQRGRHCSRQLSRWNGLTNVPILRLTHRRPKKQLALCASFYEVVMPGKE